MGGNPPSLDPQIFYDTLTRLLAELFGRNWHLGYWLNASTPAEAAERLNEVMLRRLPVSAGQRVLDIGCGMGGGSCFIARSTGARVTGISNSRAGLKMAREFAKQYAVEAVADFEFAEMARLPFAESTFDGVWSCEALHNLTNQEPLADELARVLKPGGTTVIGDLFALVEHGSSLPQLKQFSFHLFTSNDFIATLQRHGLRVQEAIDIGHHVGARAPQVSAEICRERAERSAPGTMERMILERTVAATTLLAEAFARREIGWGIWVAVKG